MDFEDGCILYNQDTQNSIILNETGKLVWKSLDEKDSEKSFLNNFSFISFLDKEDAKNDFYKTVKSLRKYEFLSEFLINE